MTIREIIDEALAEIISADNTSKITIDLLLKLSEKTSDKIIKEFEKLLNESLVMPEPKHVKEGELGIYFNEKEMINLANVPPPVRWAVTALLCYQYEKDRETIKKQITDLLSKLGKYEIPLQS